MNCDRFPDGSPLLQLRSVEEALAVLVFFPEGKPLLIDLPCLRGNAVVISSAGLRKAVGGNSVCRGPGVGRVASVALLDRVCKLPEPVPLQVVLNGIFQAEALPALCQRSVLRLHVDQLLRSLHERLLYGLRLNLRSHQLRHR